MCDGPESRALEGLKRCHCSVGEQVERLIHEIPVLLFASAHVSACKPLKLAIASAASKFTVVELEVLLVGDALAYCRYLSDRTGVPSGPWLFIDGRAVSCEGADTASLTVVELTSKVTRLCAEAGIAAPSLCSCTPLPGHMGPEAELSDIIYL